MKCWNIYVFLNFLKVFQRAFLLVIPKKIPFKNKQGYVYVLIVHQKYWSVYK